MYVAAERPRFELGYNVSADQLEIRKVRGSYVALTSSTRTPGVQHLQVETRRVVTQPAYDCVAIVTSPRLAQELIDKLNRAEGSAA